MATSNYCSVCNKELGPMYCTGCNEYFCWKDLKSHREKMFTEMDKIVEERNRLQDEINNIAQDNNQTSPLIDHIDQWRDITIEKVKLVAAQARQQAIQLLNSKRTKVNTDFKSFSQELAHLQETENYVEYDLTRLNQMINQFKQNVGQSVQPATIKLNTEQSNEIDWDHLIYVEEEPTYTDNQQQQSQSTTSSKLISRFS
jgi:chromosome segregation ATPase